MNSENIFEQRARQLNPKPSNIFEERASAIKQPPSTGKDIVKQAAIGATKGLGVYGDLLDLIGAQSKEVLPGEQSVNQREFEALQRMSQPGYKPSFSDISSVGTEEDLSPRFSRVGSGENIEDFLKLLDVDTEPKTTEGKYASRIAHAVTSGAALGGGPSTLGALGVGATAGQTAEELGADPTTAAIVELIASLGSGALKGKVLPGSKEAAKLAEAGRAIGLSEKELAPLVKGKKGFAVGTLFTRKTEGLKKFADAIQSKLGDAYKDVKSVASDAGKLPRSDAMRLVDDMRKTLGKITKSHNPSDAEKAALTLLEEAISDISGKGSSYEKLINSYQSINQQPRRVRNILEPVKAAYTRELAAKSPQLANDFQMTNKLYGQFMDRVSRLRPTDVDKLINKAEALGIGSSVFFAMMGHPWALKGLMAEAGIRSLAKQYLTNPWLQNMPNKFIHALKSDNPKNLSLLTGTFEKIAQKAQNAEEKAASDKKTKRP